ncbi:GTP cyclohydrolase II RibA [Xanthomonas hortorum]|uniref:GTP cyclohydrolase-2 n=1 Tax=Xanthomonas hortorum pv. gardneri TaxID=2754056 RepID=A0A6V7ET33_9XANT|nr:GTP cyclohydrolase II RibA [Xanthomonas hortorum]MCC4626015.1 GTP cyclohydrolase II RibA [Xanthomonas campestris pv. nigromaculans]APP79202.1 GTP cyclohydrolase [Xanthomonas hortorum pv. gardneri]EGD16517.1 GTP cyclohydrolase II [Xanthomonas hortorum ATCC 19865]KLA96989.1 GTP cyclohydrolase [Xanthomonas hortorum pv. gardneri]KLB03461.1 GTP cyclohydrolase [Xanthomonas hortorum pv. gardneri]
MSSPVPSPSAHVFGDPAAIRCERAASELRSGRPVLLTAASGQARAVLALDSSTAQSYAAFARAAQGRHYLFVTPTRAQVLDLSAPQGARVALVEHSYDQLAALAYLRDTPVPTQWAPGDALDAGAVEIARLGLLLPAMLAVDLRDADDHAAFAGCQSLALDDLATGCAKSAAAGYELVTRTPVPLRGLGMSEFVVFRGGVAQRDQVAIVVGQPDFSAAVPVRVHSSCLTGDLFGSLKCDCGDQLRHGLAKLKDLGGGVLLYLDQEGRGTGIAAKMRAYGYQHAGLDTIDADAQLGFGPDERRYGSAVAMLRGLGIGRIRLLTNNPAKAERLRAAGIGVEDRIPVTGDITPENEQYLRTKAARAGHALDVDALILAAQ